MGINFPNAPTVGQTFTGAGVTFRWNGTAWDATGGGSGGNPLVPTQDTPPATPLDGQLWWESDTGMLFLWYDDGDSGQWVQALPTIKGDTGPPGAPAVKTAQTRNRVVNPAMQISQENGDTVSATAVSANYYNADQWVTSWLFGTGTANARRVYDNTLLSIPSGYRLQANIVVAQPSLGATDNIQMVQFIEGAALVDLKWGTASAVPIVVRFGVQGTAGIYTLAIRNAAGDRSHLASFVHTGGSSVFTLAIPGDVTGTWPVGTSLGMFVGVCFACGATYQGAAGWQAGNKIHITGGSNLAAVANNYIILHSVGLYADPDGTGKAPPFEVPDYGESLRACKRYWEIIPFTMTGPSNYYGNGYWMAEKRAPPAMTTTPGNGSGGTCSAQGTSGFYQNVANSVSWGSNVIGNARM